MSRSLAFACAVLLGATMLHIWNARAADHVNAHTLYWVPSHNLGTGVVLPGHWARS